MFSKSYFPGKWGKQSLFMSLRLILLTHIFLFLLYYFGQARQQQAEILLNYITTFEGFCTLQPAHYKLIKLKVRNLSIQSLKCTFLGSNYLVFRFKSGFTELLQNILVTIINLKFFRNASQILAILLHRHVSYGQFHGFNLTRFLFFFKNNDILFPKLF